MDIEQKWKTISELVIRAQKLTTSRKYQEALDYYNQALKLEPNDALLWLKKGQSLHNLGRFREALDCYDTSLGIKPDDSGNNLKFLVWKDDWDNRLAWLTLQNKGNCLVDMGLIDESGLVFDRATEICIRSTGNEPDVLKKWLDEI